MTLNFGMTSIIAVSSVVLLMSHTARAQYASVIPEGVLAVIAGHRGFAPQDTFWNGSGKNLSMKQRTQLRFDGPHLLRGEGGEKLRTLTDELYKYDPSQGLLNRLDLGTLNVGARAESHAQIFGLALGLTKSISLFAVAPLVDLKVKTSFQLTGANNALEIRDELGGVAFDELREGLEQAANLNERDVKASIEAAQYRGVDSWRYRNLGDAIAGAVFNISVPEQNENELKLSIVGESYLSVPTGHYDNPDVLSDVSIGTGTWGLGLALTPMLDWENYSFQLENSLVAYLPHQKTMRIPELDETVIPPSRKTSVTITPGVDWMSTAVFAAKYDWFQPHYRLSLNGHTQDSASGRLSGNYSALTQESERLRFEHALWLYFSTIELYQQGQFPLPFRVKLAANQIIKAMNSSENTFFEIQFVSFLPTPWMPE
jgi:hypothetical protein